MFGPGKIGLLTWLPFSLHTSRAIYSASITLWPGPQLKQASSLEEKSLRRRL